jgi:hypothetical protein
MEENVRKELEALEVMVLNWKANYLQYATPDGGNDYLLEEFHEEISTYMSPYVRRLFQCQYITAEQAEKFLNQMYDQVEDLRRAIQDLENPPAKPGVLRTLIGKTKGVWRE